jgi:hypothetical protein
MTGTIIINGEVLLLQDEIDKIEVKSGVNENGEMYMQYTIFESVGLINTSRINQEYLGEGTDNE